MKKYLFFLALVFLASPSFAKAYDEFPVPSGFTLPEQLPYNDGVRTYTHWIAINNDSSNNWQLFYHNCENLVLDTTLLALRQQSCTEWNDLTYFSSSNSGTSWGSPNIGGANLTIYGGFFEVSVTIMGYRDVAKNHWFTDYTVFSGGTVTDDCLDNHWCDLRTISFGDVASNRVNFRADGSLIGVSSPDYSNIISGQPTSEYVDVPNPVTNPFGFVVALLTNLAIWLKNLVIPSGDFFQDKYNEMKLAFEEKFAFYFQLKDAYTIPTETTPSAFSFTGLSFGGVTLPTLTLFDGFSFFDFSPYRSFISGIMYASCGWFVIRKMSRIFSS